VSRQTRGLAVTAGAADQTLASALVELLADSPAALGRLRELITPHTPAPAPAPPAYTVASLAAMLHVSPKVIRGAITRGELAATKRAGRWVISDDAVRAWAQADPLVARNGRRSRRATGPRPLATAMSLFENGANGRRRPL
jgi:Helix-turn-helix domain